MFSPARAPAQFFRRTGRRRPQIRGTFSARGMHRLFPQREGRDAMRRVDEVMTRVPLATLEPAATVSAATRLMAERRISHVIVTDHGRVAGVVCACDLERSLDQDAIGQHMSRSPVTLALGESAFTAARCMLEQGISCLPVVQAGELVGVVTLSDLRRAGLLELAPGRCSACGDDDHVRGTDPTHEVGFCLECRRSSRPPEPDDDLGGG
jgi:CBS domain-containing protein